jgi:hypothetical protein
MAAACGLPTTPRAAQVFTLLFLPKMPSGANAFEISDIQEDEAEAVLARRTECTMLHGAENPLMELGWRDKNSSRKGA